MTGPGFHPPILFAAGDWIEIIGALLFFLITGIVQWVQKRSKAGKSAAQPSGVETPPETWGDAGRTPTTLKREDPDPEEFDIEEQLRRLLNPGKPPEPPPQAPPRLPPAPPPRIEEEPETVSWETAVGPTRPPVSPETAGAAFKKASRKEKEAIGARRPGGAGDSGRGAHSFQRASHFRKKVTFRGRDTFGKTSAPAPSTALMLGSKTSAAAAALARSLHNPASIRQAVLVSTILQPPKALDPGSH